MARPDMPGAWVGRWVGWGGMGGFLVTPDHAYTLDCQVLPVLLSGREYFLNQRTALLFWGGTLFCKKTTKSKNNTHPDILAWRHDVWGRRLGLGIGRGGVQVWLHLSSLGFTFEMCMCIYTQSSIKLCKASRGLRSGFLLQCTAVLGDCSPL